MNIVLIGFSGTGKSSVGRLLAERLGWGFVDTDLAVERASGKRIHEIFAQEGEAAFRRMESVAVRQALESGPRVVAVGGGAVVDPANRKTIREGNLVVLLDASVDTLHRRLASDVAEEPRPMLGMGTEERGDGGTRRRGDGEPEGRGDGGTGRRGDGETGSLPLQKGEGRGEGWSGRQPTTDHRARIATLKASRDAIYRETAHFVVDTEGDNVEGVVRRILAAIDDRKGIATGQPSPRPSSRERGGRTVTERDG